VVLVAVAILEQLVQQMLELLVQPTQAVEVAVQTIQDLVVVRLAEMAVAVS
jgi:hypothetical protein